jgi:hypothetical protein
MDKSSASTGYPDIDPPRVKIRVPFTLTACAKTTLRITVELVRKRDPHASAVLPRKWLIERTPTPGSSATFLKGCI